MRIMRACLRVNQQVSADANCRAEFALAGKTAAIPSIMLLYGFSDSPPKTLRDVRRFRLASYEPSHRNDHHDRDPRRARFVGAVDPDQEVMPSFAGDFFNIRSGKWCCQQNHTPT